MVFNNRTPLYTQIISIIKNDILSGVYKPGDKLPSVRELALKYTVNVNTVLHSYKELEMENIIFTKRGIGYFVSENSTLINSIKEKELEALINNFIKDMMSLGYSKKEIISHIKENDYDIKD